jgi:enoyl-CoA hydratase
MSANTPNMGDVSYRREGAIGILSLDRPDKLNAMTHFMGDRLRALVPELNRDAELRCLIVRGEGRAFSAGGDLDFLIENAARTPEQNERGMQDFYTKYLALREIEVPTIAVLHGRATGAGLCLALGCDMRVAADDAVLSVNFVRLGLTPGMGGSWNLPRLVGPALAAELLFTGRTVSAEEALRIGLVNAVHPAAEALGQAMAMARQIAEAAPGAVRECKALLRQNATNDISAALEAEAKAQAWCFASRDLQEGIAAIKERRPARF